jgi:ubiquitin-conjugating enzyme E2 S
MRELSELENNPPEGIRVQTNDEDMLDVTGIIEGPGTSISINLSNCSLISVTEGTPYAGGYFRVKFKFTEEFPSAPPKCMPILFVLHL